VNASAVWTPAHAKRSRSTRETLAQIVPRAADDENASSRRLSIRKSRTHQRDHRSGLTEPGARDVTAAYRDGERLVNWNNCSYLLPTVILSNRSSARDERVSLSVRQCRASRSRRDSALLGPTLVVTAITKDPKLIQTLVASPRIDRLNIGALPTNQVIGINRTRKSLRTSYARRHSNTRSPSEDTR
jgi:hypothetical protein